MTAHPVDDREFGDLTARARIRDAALSLFAERGIDGATIRDIGRAAGVSAGLVRHHFGSKEALRNACDAHALDRLMRIKEKAVFDGQSGNPAFIAAAHPTAMLLMRYFARSMVDDSPAAAALFDQMVDLAEQWVTTHRPEVSADPRAYAAVLVAMQTGLLVLRDHASRALGADIFDPAGHPRMNKALVDFYSHALLSPDLAAQMHEVLDRLQAQQPATAEPRPADEGAQR